MSDYSDIFTPKLSTNKLDIYENKVYSVIKKQKIVY